MMTKIQVAKSGDSRFLPGEIVNKFVFLDENSRIREAGKAVAEGTPVLQGITKASLTTDSWLSAASFQETTRVLTKAAIKSKVDGLKGLKENIIIGHLIPAGTGHYRYVDMDIQAPEGFEPPPPPPPVEEIPEAVLLAIGDDDL